VVTEQPHILLIDDDRDIRDPLAGEFTLIVERAAGSPESLLDGLLGLDDVFGDDLPNNTSFRRTVQDHLDSLFRVGAVETVRRALRQT
jgi:fructuronate reductase